MTDLAEIQAFVMSSFWLAFFVFLRVGAAMALLPGFSENSIPARIRLILALCFTAIIAPALASDLDQVLSTPKVEVWIGEIGIGLMLGLSLRLTVMALQIAGTMIAQSISLSQVFVSAGSEPMTVIGELLVLGGITLAVTLGLHVEISRCLIQSYQDLAPGALPTAGEALGWILVRTAAAFSLAFALALPFIAASLIYNIALGLINRAMPQLMVAMVGAPALTLGGMFLLMLCAPLIISRWIRHLGEILAMPF